MNIKTILVVDDDRWLSNSLQQILQKEGYVVQVTGNGHEAMEWLQANGPVDLVITDKYMEGLDGIETVTALKKSYPDIKILAMSGGSSIVKMDCLPVAKILGADRTLSKPASVPDLLNMIHELDSLVGR